MTCVCKNKFDIDSWRHITYEVCRHLYRALSHLFFKWLLASGYFVLHPESLVQIITYKVFVKSCAMSRLLQQFQSTQYVFALQFFFVYILTHLLKDPKPIEGANLIQLKQLEIDSNKTCRFFVPHKTYLMAMWYNKSRP